MDKTRTAAYIAVLLAFIVVILGAYTRLTDAGLGCPDWPGCYGHWIVEAGTIAPAKAWAEMIHRYAAGTLGLLILFLAGTAIIRRQKRLIPFALIILVIFQAALGRWTVTLQLLPVVVMGHLLGGMSILALLWLLALKNGGHLQLRYPAENRKFRFWAFLGLLIVFAQISLGGWTSTNYAALVCPDFPLCQGQWLPVHEWRTAFNVFMPLGQNFEGGVLDTAARVTIQAVHRLGAAITAIFLLALSIGMLCLGCEKKLKKIIFYMILLLILQIFLGILNVLFMLPLPIAVLHNAGAALLLLAVVTLNAALY